MSQENDWIRTVCGRMDHGGCGLYVKKEHGRLIAVRGDPDFPLSRGYICRKARASLEKSNHPGRLTHPLKREGPRGSGRWARIGWDDALSYTAEQLNGVKKDAGARAVAFCQGAPKGLEHFVLIRLANIFGSPNVVGPQNVCHMPRELAARATCGFYPVPDYDHPTRCVLLWGSHPTATNEEGIICVRLLDRLKKDGAPLIVVDPYGTDLARKADVWLRIRPGTDHILALGLLHVIIRKKLYDPAFVSDWTSGFDGLAEAAAPYDPDCVADRCGLTADTVEKAAVLYGKARPGTIHWGNGIEHRVENFQVCRAIVCLMALCGNLDRPGGNVEAAMPKVIPLAQFVRSDLLPGKLQQMISAEGGPGIRFMISPPPLLKRAILTGQPYPVRAAYVQVSNPLISWADSRSTREAFNRLDFLAVSDIFMTPTAAMADIVFPAATHFEFNDLGHFGLPHGFILPRPALVEPPGECRPDIRILNELGKYLTDDALWWDHHENMIDDILAPAGMRFSDLLEAGILRGPEIFQKYRRKGFKTADRKVNLSPASPDGRGAPAPASPDVPPGRENQAFPLILTSMKNRHYFNSSYRQLTLLRKETPGPQAEMHPATAKRYGIRADDTVRIETPFGRIRQTARITEDVPPDVIYAAQGWYYPEMDEKGLFGWDQSNLNMLTSADPIGPALGTPNMRALPCRIKKQDA
jgi:anaerobic selenocysteine-containing dehydrogenase